MQLYIGLRQLPVFRQHKLSKAATNWRRAVSNAKGAKARAALAGAAGLYVLSPAFQAPLRRVWGLCCDVGALRLHVLRAGQVGEGRGCYGWLARLVADEAVAVMCIGMSSGWLAYEAKGNPVVGCQGAAAKSSQRHCGMCQTCTTLKGRMRSHTHTRARRTPALH